MVVWKSDLVGSMTLFQPRIQLVLIRAGFESSQKWPAFGSLTQLVASEGIKLAGIINQSFFKLVQQSASNQSLGFKSNGF